jgi:hypothetical protein
MGGLGFSQQSATAEERREPSGWTARKQEFRAIEVKAKVRQIANGAENGALPFTKARL